MARLGGGATPSYRVELTGEDEVLYMRHGKRDLNHKQIRDKLRGIPGVSVADTADMGCGFPDLVVGYKGQTFMLEVKSERGVVRDSQSAFLRGWRGGPYAVVHSFEEACMEIGLAVAA